MRKATSGFLLIVPGVAVLGIGYLMPSRGTTDQPQQQSEIAKSQPATPRIPPPVVSDGWRTFRRAETVPAAIESMPMPVVVTLAARPPLPPPQKATSMPSDRASLTRELQHELKRVGCYEGELNGTWSPPTRKAMKTFNDRINAVLPIGEPDQILLRLVQSHQDKVCGAPCPAGQSLAHEGRCLPNAILAQAHKKASQRTAVTEPRYPTTSAAESTIPPITSWSTTTTTMAPTLPLPGGEERMALAGPAGEQPNVTPNAPGLPVSAGTTVPPRRAVPQRSNFAQGFFKRLDRMSAN